MSKKGKKRTLYDCSHARVRERRIYCEKGCSLSPESGDSGMDIRHLEQGEPLAVKVCRQCGDFDSMGPPVPEQERGWLRAKGRERYLVINGEPLQKALA